MNEATLDTLDTAGAIILIIIGVFLVLIFAAYLCDRFGRDRDYFDEE